MRLVAAAWTPLTFDEAYYWIWSKHLASSYYDHPPAVALVIRLGTMIAGDTELGVRLISILLALPMSFAIYRTAKILFGGRLASTATIFLNVTLMAAVGTLIVTPDLPLLVASSFVLFFLAKLLETGRGAWWLAVGAAVGVALFQNTPRCFSDPDPDLACKRAETAPLADLALAVSRRARGASRVCAGHSLERRSPLGLLHQAVRPFEITHFKPGFIAELIPTQIAFATPLVFLLGAMGLYALSRREGGGALAARALISAMFWTITLYFIWHSLHARVEANWFAPVYPAFAIAAAAVRTSPNGSDTSSAS